jgi:hypothetical protein
MNKTTNGDLHFFGVGDTQTRTTKTIYDNLTRRRKKKEEDEEKREKINERAIKFLFLSLSLRDKQIIAATIIQQIRKHAHKDKNIFKKSFDTGPKSKKRCRLFSDRLPP